MRLDELEWKPPPAYIFNQNLRIADVRGIRIVDRGDGTYNVNPCVDGSYDILFRLDPLSAQCVLYHLLGSAEPKSTT